MNWSTLPETGVCRPWQSKPKLGMAPDNNGLNESGITEQGDHQTVQNSINGHGHLWNRGYPVQLLYIITLCFSVPTPPAFFTKVVNVTSVQVLWELPNKPGKVEGFRLSFRRVPHGDFQGSVQMSCHTNVYTIGHLGKFERVWEYIVKYGFFLCVCES